MSPISIDLRPLTLAALLGLGACSSKGESTDSGVDTGDLPGSAAERAACAQTAEAGVTMTPITQLTSQAPAMQLLDTPYTVELFQDRGGYVRLPADAGTAGPRSVFLGRADVVTAVVDEGGEPVDFTQSAGAACPSSIPVRLDLELQEGTVFLLFTPSPYPSIWALTSRP